MLWLPKISERWRYWFDNLMSRGTPALIGLLGLASVVLVAIVTGLVILVSPREVGGPGDALWKSLMRAIDPGTIGGDEGAPIFLALMLVVTVGGIFIVSSLVGVLATGLQDKLADLRKGRSRIVEEGHTVVLGWSDQLPTIIAELAHAAEGERICITILADRDKVEMEDALRTLVNGTRLVRVVCRTGNPAKPSDLEIVRPDRAAVIMLPTPDGDDPDVRVIKTLLALRHRPWPTGQPPIVVAVADSANMPAAVLAGGPAVTFVDAEDVTARLIVQSRRHPGLSAVCTDLLGFEREEIHTRAEPELAGSTYREALLAYETATLFGLRRAGGKVEVNPGSETILRADDELIVLAASKRSIRRATERPPIMHDLISHVPRSPDPVERTLMLGWNHHGFNIINLLDGYLPEGSVLTIAATRLDAKTGKRINGLGNISVRTAGCDPTNRRDLEALEPQGCEHIVVLADDGFAEQHADARTLVTLLHLRDIKDRHGYHYTIVGELNDDANRGLAQVTRADDFVVSSKMVSLLLTQLSRNSHLAAIFAELFDPGGADIYLKPAADYLIPGAQANFATVIEAARLRGQTAIGYRLDADANTPPTYGVVLNPDKAAPLTLTEADRVVVLSED